jgi:uncharacterized protein YdeI (YjbR/CyaY-like superfamily)
MGKHDDAERRQFATRAAWRSWLAKHHDSSTGLFVVYFKKGANRAGPAYEDLIQEALCFGWIDGTARSVDAERTSLWFCPRRPGSIWAASNKARVELLRAAGSMTAAGEAAIERARADGSWTVLDRAEALTLPPELEQVLAADAAARAAFDALIPSARKQLIYQVDSAKRAETRVRRAEQVARAITAP